MWSNHRTMMLGPFCFSSPWCEKLKSKFCRDLQAKKTTSTVEDAWNAVSSNLWLGICFYIFVGFDSESLMNFGKTKVCTGMAGKTLSSDREYDFFHGRSVVAPMPYIQTSGVFVSIWSLCASCFVLRFLSEPESRGILRKVLLPFTENGFGWSVKWS